MTLFITITLYILVTGFLLRYKLMQVTCDGLSFKNAYFLFGYFIFVALLIALNFRFLLFFIFSL